MDLKAYVGLLPGLTANRAPLLFLAPFPMFCLGKSEQERPSFLCTYVDTSKIYLVWLPEILGCLIWASLLKAVWD